jgi:hypothetical protein
MIQHRLRARSRFRENLFGSGRKIVHVATIPSTSVCPVVDIIWFCRCCRNSAAPDCSVRPLRGMRCTPNAPAGRRCGTRQGVNYSARKAETGSSSEARLAGK